MNSWMCPVKPRSWNIIKKKGIFGAPRNAYKTMEMLSVGDVLFFHVFKPVNGLIGKVKVISEMYKDNENIWGKDLYLYRVKIEVLNDLLAEKRQPIPLSCLFGNSINKEISIEPYLHNVRIVKIPKGQSEFLTKLFEERLE